MNPKRKNKRKTPQTVGEFLNNANIFYAIGKEAIKGACNDKETYLRNNEYSYFIPLSKDRNGLVSGFNANPIVFPFPGIYCPLNDELTQYEQTHSDEYSAPSVGIDEDKVNHAWSKFTEKSEQLQTQYLMHSGDKELNTSLKWLGDVNQKTTGSLELKEPTELAQLLVNKYWERWCHLAYINNSSLSYNPIWNTEKDNNTYDSRHEGNTETIEEVVKTTTTYDSKVSHTLNQTETTDNTGTQKTDTNDTNTQTLDTNKSNTGTSTRTDNLTNATTVDGTTTRTDALQQYQTHDGTETRTDDLSQATDTTKTNTQTLNTNDLTTNDLKTSDIENTTNKETRDLTQDHTGTDATQYNTTDKTIETNSNTTISTDSGSDSSNKTTTNDLTETAKKTGTNNDTTHYDTKDSKETTIDEQQTTTYGTTSTETQIGTVSKSGANNTEKAFNRKYTDNTTRDYDSYSENTSGSDNHEITYNDEKEETTIAPKTTYTSTNTTTTETPSGQDKTVETQKNGRYAFNSSALSNVSQVEDTTLVGEIDADGNPVNGRSITTKVEGAEQQNYVKESYENNTPQTITKSGGHTDNATQGSSKNITGSYSDKRTYEDDGTKNTERETTSTSDTTTNDLTNTTKKTGNDIVGKHDTNTELYTKSGSDGTEHTFDETTTTTNTGTVTDATTNTYGKINNTTDNGNKSDTTTKTGTDTETKNLKDTETGTVSTTTDTTKTGTQTGTVSVDKTGTIKDDGTETQTVKNTGTQTNANNWQESTSNTGTQTNKEDTTQTEKQTGTQATENNLNEATTGTVKDDRTIGQTRTDNLKQVAQLQGENSDGKSGSDTVASTNSRTNYLNKSYDNSHQENAFGNIGVTTTQQMLNEEVNFWANYDYLEYVFQDIDKILAVDIY